MIRRASRLVLRQIAGGARNDNPYRVGMLAAVLSVFSIVLKDSELTAVSISIIGLLLVASQILGLSIQALFVVASFFSFHHSLGVLGSSFLLSDFLLPFVLVYLIRVGWQTPLKRPLIIRGVSVVTSGAAVFFLLSLLGFLAPDSLDLVAYLAGIAKIFVGASYLLAIVLLTILMSATDLIQVVRSFVTSASTLGLLGLLLALSDFPLDSTNFFTAGRFDGAHLDAVLMGLYMGLGLFGCLYLISRGGAGPSLWLCVFVLSVSIGLTQSRSVAVGTVLGIIVLLVWMLFTARWQASVLMAGALTLVAVPATLFLQGGATRFLAVPSDVRFRNLAPAVNGDSTVERGLWELAIQSFSASPLTGVGWGQFMRISSNEGLPHLPHNTVLTIIAEGGVFVGLFFVLVLTVLLGGLLTSRSEVSGFLLAFFVLVGLVSVFIDLQTSRIFWVLVGALYAHKLQVTLKT